MGGDVLIETVSHNFLQYFTNAFHQADGSISLWLAVIRLLGFVDDDDGGLAPRVCSLFEADVEEPRESIGAGFIGPLEDVISNPTRPRC